MDWLLIVLIAVIALQLNGLIGLQIQNDVVKSLVVQNMWLMDRAIPHSLTGIMFAAYFWPLWLLWFWYWYKKGEQPYP